MFSGNDATLTYGKGTVLVVAQDADGCWYGNYYSLLLVSLISQRLDKLKELQLLFHKSRIYDYVPADLSDKMKSIVNELIIFLVTERKLIDVEFKGLNAKPGVNHDPHEAIKRLHEFGMRNILRRELGVRSNPRVNDQRDYLHRSIAKIKCKYLTLLQNTGKYGRDVNQVLLIQANLSWIDLLQARVMTENVAILDGQSASNRQSHAVNQYNIGNGTGDFMADLDVSIASMSTRINRDYARDNKPQNVVGLFDPFLSTDVYGDFFAGYSYQLMMNEAQMNNSTPIKHPVGVFDKTKFSLLYLLLQHKANVYADRQVVFCFSDDVIKIHDVNIKLFLHNRDLIPANVTMEFYYYQGGEIHDLEGYPNRMLARIRGAGVIDTHYRDSLKELVRLVGANDQHYFGHMPLNVGKIILRDEALHSSLSGRLQQVAGGQDTRILTRFRAWRVENMKRPIPSYLTGSRITPYVATSLSTDAVVLSAAAAALPPATSAHVASVPASDSAASASVVSASTASASVASAAAAPTTVSHASHRSHIDLGYTLYRAAGLYRSVVAPVSTFFHTAVPVNRDAVEMTELSSSVTSAPKP